MEDYNSLKSRVGRSASAGAIGGSRSLGTFQFRQPLTVAGLPKSYSISMDGSGPSYLTPSQMGRQELYVEIPFQAVFGLQRKEHSLSLAFADYAAHLDVDTHQELTQEEKTSRLSRASMIILDELEFEANVVTVPLVFAVVVAAACQFLVGYNTGVMNAPARVVFPGHSTLSWGLAVAAFAAGGPFGAVAGGRLADRRGRRGALLIDTWTFLLGGLLQTLAPDMWTVIVSRFVIGFASGYSSVLVPIYLGEMAPPTLRGMLGTLTQFAMVRLSLTAVSRHHSFVFIRLADYDCCSFATGDWYSCFRSIGFSVCRAGQVALSVCRDTRHCDHTAHHGTLFARESAVVARAGSKIAQSTLYYQTPAWSAIRPRSGNRGWVFRHWR